MKVQKGRSSNRMNETQPIGWAGPGVLARKPVNTMKQVLKRRIQNG
jgi:hypothetical protein